MKNLTKILLITSWSFFRNYQVNEMLYLTFESMTRVLPNTGSFFMIPRFIRSSILGLLKKNFLNLSLILDFSFTMGTLTTLGESGSLLPPLTTIWPPTVSFSDFVLFTLLLPRLLLLVLNRVEVVDAPSARLPRGGKDDAAPSMVADFCCSMLRTTSSFWLNVTITVSILENQSLAMVKSSSWEQMQNILQLCKYVE